MAAAQENRDVRAIRRRAADASIGFGVIATLLAVLLGASPLLPGLVIIAAGGLFAVGVYAASDTTMSRWFTLWSVALTLVGIGAAALADRLAG